MKINLSNDFGVDREKDKQTPPDEEITISLINQAIRLAFPNLQGDKRRLYASLETRLVKAVEDKATEVEVNEYELRFIKEAFEKAPVPTQNSKAFTTVENVILDVK